MRTWIPTGATTALLTAGLAIAGTGVAYAEMAPATANPMPVSGADTTKPPVITGSGAPEPAPTGDSTDGAPGNPGDPTLADSPAAAGGHSGHPQRQIAARRAAVLTPVREQRRVDPAGRNGRAGRADTAGGTNSIGRTGPMSGGARLLPQDGPAGMAQR